MSKIAVVSYSKKGDALADILASELDNITLFSTLGASRDSESSKASSTGGVTELLAAEFHNYSEWIFIGALGIAVRAIAPHLKDKKQDPAVINIDSYGNYVQSVISGHVGGANALTERVARIVGAVPVVSTQSDNAGLWSLDTIGKKFQWISEQTSKQISNRDSASNISSVSNISSASNSTSVSVSSRASSSKMNGAIATFVNEEPTALLLEVRDSGTDYLERTKPDFVDIYYKSEDIDISKYKLLLAVTPYIHDYTIPEAIYFRPKVLHLGVGCRKDADPSGVVDLIKSRLLKESLAWSSVASVETITLKSNEPLVKEIAAAVGVEHHCYTTEELEAITVPNPSDKVFEVTGVYGVSEATALKRSGNIRLIIEKQKEQIEVGSNFTFAVALDVSAEREGFIEIVGAGPGDPELISVKGKRFLQSADLILYAGSLVPEELTHYAKPGAVVRSSAAMNLEEQFQIMKEFYDRGLFVVRLHTGDPCIYGAIQEQMSYFDEYNMRYHITPGISSFLAAAAALKSQFTIPEKVQTIILTRGEGRTPMPDKEKLHLLARSQSTMCIFLSATIVDKVQRDLLEHYPPETPVAACYKLTWRDEKIYRGTLENLSSIIKDNNLTLTTMIVVGASIDNRGGLSKLYSHKFKHLFRETKEKQIIGITTDK